MKTLSAPPHTVFLATQIPSSHFSVECFDPQWLKQQGWLTGSSDDSGRNPAWFFALQDGECVLRHYWRGGLPGKVLKDSFLFTGVERSRPYRELALMDWMFQQGLPVAQPVAARLSRSGLRYRADLITIKLPNSQDLVGALQQGNLGKREWQKIGKMIARFHDAGVYHADLNARNILLSDGDYYLIDFDRGERRRPHKGWMQSNLERLKRSLDKELGRVEGLNFKPERDWPALVEGYVA
ncbi:3-deoxy-D-manno-octulosonic acid kinase [Ferrimonas marina]|uniref:3-deoxy-D-manno-octulosonic acid kinase n=1 Tax=Ferrimonas marina TaxID=299255 RepID=A0A1M5ZA45_9GAMM|nr:3-deoxy-D-manno-octulosonic acid kinase [Ferrimonas marina]SHI21062.1 3-deoxy-D-manno-octulosonic acid kinase [Ferrimonas marina]